MLMCKLPYTGIRNVLYFSLQ